MSFESRLARLESLVAELGRGDVELERALQLFEEGVAELRAAAVELSRVEDRMAVLRETAEGVFDPPANA